MSSAAAHRNFALICSAVVSVYDECPDQERAVLLLAMAGSGIVGAKLPDILEPAIHSHHRAFFHSLVVAGGVAWAIRKILAWPRETPGQRLVRATALGFAVGYVSHLALDALTPRGLPAF